MLTKRIIPCLDIDRGRVVKGVSFVDIRDAGDPVELAALYDREGADELVFLDITASSDARDIMIDVVKQVSEQVFIPLTVGGGVRSVAGVRALLEAGADKVSLNTAAVQRPQLIAETSDFFGCQCIVVAIDYKRLEDGDGNVPGPGAADPSLALDQSSRWEVYTHGGRNRTWIDAVKWAKSRGGVGRGRAAGHQYGRRRTPGRVRPGIHAGGVGGHGDTGHRQRRRGRAGPRARGPGRGQGRRRPGRQHLPFREAEHPRDQGLSRGAGDPRTPDNRRSGLGRRDGSAGRKRAGAGDRPARGDGRGADDGLRQCRVV